MFVKASKGQSPEPGFFNKGMETLRSLHWFVLDHFKRINKPASLEKISFLQSCLEGSKPFIEIGTKFDFLSISKKAKTHAHQKVASKGNFKLSKERIFNKMSGVIGKPGNILQTNDNDTRKATEVLKLGKREVWI